MAHPHVLTGSGEHKVLAVHGWFGSARGWGHFPDYVDRSRFCYAFMDIRGYGAAKQLDGEFTMQQVAADLLDLADELGWAEFSLVGHSMGGMAVQHVLATAPQRVRRLVGISPVPATGVPFDDAGWQLFSGAATDRSKREAIIDLTTGNRLTRAFIEAVVQHSLDESTVAAFGAYLESWARTDFSAQVKGNPAPVKVIVGEHDPALSAAVMEQTFLQLYPNAALEVLPNAGHYAMFETPVALASSVESFLAGP